MRRWILLAVAIGCEVAATLSLRAAVDRPVWYAVVAVGYVGSFSAFGFSLRGGVPIGVGYGIWSATGVAATAVLASVVFGDVFTPVTLAGIALIIVGVFAVELGAQAVATERAS